MSLNPIYVTAPNFQQFFVDKNGLPLASGQIYFYSDVNRTDPKPVYTLSGSEANYSYIPLPNPLTLSAAGTVVDDQGFPVVIYWKPVNEQFPNEQELYYVVLKDQFGATQQIVQAWPNPGSGEVPSATDSTKNYVPNGQFLAHTNLPNDLLVAGSNIVAQGGFSMEMGGALFSTNTFVFTQITATPSGYSNSPRYKAVANCASNLADDQKHFRLKFRDVNKFSSETTNIYTYSFWAKSSVTTPVNIYLVKNFGTGGTTETSTLIEPISIGTDLNVYNITIDFGNNDGTFVGTLNDDFVAIDIALPLDIAFTIEFSDFSMIQGSTAPVNFPLQTNADMLSMGVAGWMPQPNPDGSDLFCPLVLTREGMEFDHSEIGMIYASPGAVLSPSNPLATTNLMPCDGSTYLSGDYSAIGVPYSRLLNYLLTSSPVADYPMYGTGSNFATAWSDLTDDTTFYLIVNNAGTPIAAAADGTTGASFSSIMTYAGTQTGRTAIYPRTSWSATGLFQAVDSALTTTVVTDGAPATGFGLALFDPATGLFAGQTTTGFYGTSTTTAALAVGGGQCKYFNVTYGGTTYKVQYRISGAGTVTSGANDITIDLVSSLNPLSIATVSQMTSYALRGLQVTKITVGAVPTAGQYWTFQANPGATQNYYVWYTVNGAGTDPNPGGIGIKVALTSSETVDSAITKTYTTINSYQFAVPDIRGMFLRGTDLTAIWDADRATRFAQGVGPGGSFGSFEYPQLESHNHYYTTGVGGGTDSFSRNNVNTGTANINILPTGGSETRPVNSYVNWVIKY